MMSTEQKDFFEAFWSKIKVKASLDNPEVILIKKGEREIIIDQENRCWAVKGKARDFRK